MLQRITIKKIIISSILVLIFSCALFAQQESSERIVVEGDTGTIVGSSSEETVQTPEQQTDDFTLFPFFKKRARPQYDFSYYLGTDYTFSLDMLLYQNVPFYQTLKVGDSPFTEDFVDKVGSNGHFFRVTNIFEWRKDKLSFSLFANLTLNYIPTFVKASVMWVPACLQGALGCASGIWALWSGALTGTWMVVNLATFFLIPIVGTVICATGCAICLLAIPLSMTLFALPMASVAGSIDYHPYMTDLFDTKVSLGLDIDCYRGILHGGFAGVYAQGEASVNIKKFRAYTQLGYRVDIINVLASIQTKKGTVTDACRYVPAPYIKAGVAFKIK